MIGLCVILFVSWRAIEWKTYEASDLFLQKLNIDDDDDEEVPLTEQIKTPPPPPPPPAPEIIEIVEDEEEVEETIIESTETTQEEIIEEVEVLDDFDVDVLLQSSKTCQFSWLRTLRKTSGEIAFKKKFNVTSVETATPRLPKKWIR